MKNQNSIKEKFQSVNNNTGLIPNKNIYSKLIRKIVLITFILLSIIYHGLQIEISRNFGWEIVRIIEIILGFLLIGDSLYLQIFFIKFVSYF